MDLDLGRVTTITKQLGSTVTACVQGGAQTFQAHRRIAMFRSIFVVPLSFAGFLFIFVPLGTVSTNVSGQEAGRTVRTVKPLTEADLVALIGRQADDQAILRR